VLQDDGTSSPHDDRIPPRLSTQVNENVCVNEKPSPSPLPAEDLDARSATSVLEEGDTVFMGVPKPAERELGAAPQDVATALLLYAAYRLGPDAEALTRAAFSAARRALTQFSVSTLLFVLRGAFDSPHNRQGRRRRIRFLFGTPRRIETLAKLGAEAFDRDKLRPPKADATQATSQPANDGPEPYGEAHQDPCEVGPTDEDRAALIALLGEEWLKTETPTRAKEARPVPRWLRDQLAEASRLYAQFIDADEDCFEARQARELYERARAAVDTYGNRELDTR
jgi:hypothetical protein